MPILVTPETQQSPHLVVGKDLQVQKAVVIEQEVALAGKLAF
jgi:hypothetical protein